MTDTLVQSVCLEGEIQTRCLLTFMNIVNLRASNSTHFSVLYINQTGWPTLFKVYYCVYDKKYYIVYVYATKGDLYNVHVLRMCIMPIKGIANNECTVQWCHMGQESIYT